MFNSMSYYSKLKVCDYCKDLDCEIIMVKHSALGLICPLCQKNVEGQQRKLIELQQQSDKETDKLEADILTY